MMIRVSPSRIIDMFDRAEIRKQYCVCSPEIHFYIVCPRAAV